jgi:hypothetical protein
MHRAALYQRSGGLVISHRNGSSNGRITSVAPHRFKQRAAASAAQRDGPASAAAAPELRKNPDLYSALTGGGASSSTSTTPAPSHLSTTGSYSSAPPGSGAPPLVPIRRLTKRPEVLAPAGGWPQLRAAVEAGADAVYFGLSEFNARARASNFAADELPEVMAYLRARGVRGYVALNVLVFDAELARLEERVREIAAAGADAVIVQDVGAAALIRRVAPSLPIHASTQMSITSAEGAAFAARLGAKRVVVGRELSVREIAAVAAGANNGGGDGGGGGGGESSGSSNSSVEVEAFAHGALCVSYSGQCFSSESWCVALRCFLLRLLTYLL